MEPVFFKTPADFGKWLDKNHEKETELLVGFYKKGSGKPSITWPESVEEALCYGWIDGVRKSYSEDSYTIRFTPRKAKSTWSAVNIKKMEELLENGKIRPAGLAAYQKREESNSKIYAYEQESHGLSEEYEKEFKKHATAWKFFTAQPPYYRKQMMHRVMSAKQEKTRQSRLEKLIAASNEGIRLL